MKVRLNPTNQDEHPESSPLSPPPASPNRLIRWAKQLLIAFSVFLLGVILMGLVVVVFYNQVGASYASVQEPSILNNKQLSRMPEVLNDQETDHSVFSNLGKHGKINEEWVDVHTSPDPDSRVWIRLFNTMVVEIVNQRNNQEEPEALEGRWYKVMTSDGYQGWIPASKLEITDSPLTSESISKQKRIQAAEQYYNQAMDYMDVGNYDQARSLLEVALQINPDDERIQMELQNLSVDMPYYESTHSMEESFYQEDEWNPSFNFYLDDGSALSNDESGEPYPEDQAVPEPIIELTPEEVEAYDALDEAIRQMETDNHDTHNENANNQDSPIKPTDHTDTESTPTPHPPLSEPKDELDDQIDDILDTIFTEE